MDNLTFSNDLLLHAITVKDYDRIEKLAKLSYRNKISIDKRVVDAAKSGGKYVAILLSHAYNGVSAFIKYMAPDDDVAIFRHMLRSLDVNVNDIIYRAIAGECYNIINMLILCSHVDMYRLFAIALSQDKTTVINYLRENYIHERYLCHLFQHAYYNRDFKLAKYCIDECGEDYSRYSMFLCTLSCGLLLTDLCDQNTYNVLECVVLLLNKGANIDVIRNEILDDNILSLYKMGVNNLGKFTKRLQVLFIREYAIKEEIRETIPELPDELTNLITGY